MAHLWLEQKEGEEFVWVLVSLEGNGSVFYLSSNAEHPAVASNGERPADSTAYLVRHSAGPNQAETWMLYAAPVPSVHVNGRQLVLGIHRLEDKDEIRLAANRMLFSTESLPRVESFRGIGKPALCPRCRQAIQAGTNAVKCPGCAVWYHQSEQLPCWTYGETCCLCQRSTDLEGGYAWTPEDL